MNVTPGEVLNYRWRGGIFALAVFAGWAASLSAGLWFVPLGLESLPAVVLLVLAIEFFDTGLFITAHDAMHRTLLPMHPRLNDLVGRLAVFLFALFSYPMLVRKHAEHHRSPARETDPDFHDGSHPSFVPWYGHFMANYVTARQLTGMACVFCVLWLAVGVPIERVIVFWAMPALLSTLQLFTFGTYLPHRMPAGGYVEPHRARSNDYPRWLSLLTCYHFGYHLEHHQYPFIPWWKLGRFRAELLARGSQEAGSRREHTAM